MRGKVKMKGIKDFFHDSNDFILAILIIVMAAGLIYWRLSVIMDYPDKVAAEAAAKAVKQSEMQEKDAEDDKSSEKSEDKNADSSKTEGESGDKAVED